MPEIKKRKKELKKYRKKLYIEIQKKIEKYKNN